MRWLLALLLLSSCATAVPNTGNGPDCRGCGSWNDYHNQDKFQWSDTDQQLHLAVTFVGTFVAAEVLQRKFNLTHNEATLVALGVSMLASAVHEVYFDHFNSRTDLKTLFAGTLAGGLTFYIVRF